MARLYWKWTAHRKPAQPTKDGLASRRELRQAYLTMEPLADLARVALVQGDLGQTRACTDEMLSYLESSSLDSTEVPFRIYLTCHHVLSATEDARARGILATPRGLLQEQAARIRDARMRRSFLESVAAQQAIPREFALTGAGSSRVFLGSG